MDKQIKNKKTISLGIVLFIVMLLVSGGSYAYWTWVTATSERTNVALTIEAPDMTATLTGYTKNITNLIPVSSCTDETYAIKKELTLTYENLSTNAGEILGTLSIDNFTSPYGTPDSDDLSHLHYAVTTSDTNCTTDALNGMSGTFTSTTGSLFTSQKLKGPIPAGTEETSQTYYLWVWLDNSYTHQNVGSGVVSDPMQDISFTLVWTGEIKNDLIPLPDPEAPTLDEGMIPVTISADGVVTTITSDDENWYDYSNKEWANVVLVNETATADVEGSQSRNYYQNNLANNVTVNESDILAYYVWIPRYKYKLWTVDATTTTSPQTIDIQFENADAEMTLGTTVGSYRTHPAFWWDDNSDGVVDAGETIAGIWVGKFETSTETSSACYQNISSNDCNNTDQSPRIIPNVMGLRYQSIDNQFQTSLKFSGGVFDTATGEVTFSGSSFFGLASTTDSHMMKNVDWGAVAYLSHSEYGINREIYISNTQGGMNGSNAGPIGFYTGRSGGNVGGSVNTLEVQFPNDLTISDDNKTYVSNKYGYYTWLGQMIDSSGNIGEYTSDRTLGTYASTTGNVTGVYDMVGGLSETVMGNYGNTIFLEGFTVFPNIKYYDLYSEEQFTGTYNTNLSLCTLETCGGHALYETAGWYSDASSQFIASNNYPWFTRSNGYSSSAGVFSFDYVFGISSTNYGNGFRSIVIVN